jgi:diadenosine tetraphosphate (Ap4A) HIT family hydrolase
VIEKNRVLEFLTINPFSTCFLLNISRKHLKNLGKPIHDLKKPTQNPKSS